MFVPAWLIWIALAVLVGPFILIGLFSAYAHALFVLSPPKVGSIRDPLGEELARGTWMHKYFMAPPQTDRTHSLTNCPPRPEGDDAQ